MLPVARAMSSTAASDAATAGSDSTSGDTPPPAERPSYLRLTEAVLVLPTGTLSQPCTLLADKATGRIVASDADLFNPGDAEVVDCAGLLLSPGMIDIQINGAFGVDLSEAVPREAYIQGVTRMGEGLAQMGVTSFVPTIITPDAYHHVLPLLAELAGAARPAACATQLGWHAEGPFLCPQKAGCHPPANLATVSAADDIERVYGADALSARHDSLVRIVTLAPDVPGVLEAIPRLADQGIVCAIGHTNATHAQAVEATRGGATLLTHLFNAMPPLHHREPGVVGLLGAPIAPSVDTAKVRAYQSQQPSPVTEGMQLDIPPAIPEEDEFELVDRDSRSAPSTPTALLDAVDARPSTAQNVFVRLDAVPDVPTTAAPIPRPFISIIADGVHVHPMAVGLAYRAHPAGCVLVSDAMHMLDPALADGEHPWRDGSITKAAGAITLTGTDTLAGSILALPDAVANLARFAGISLPEAIVCATYNPARCLGSTVERSKGMLVPGADADLCLWTPDGRVARVWTGAREV